jgi:hypothetical protein
MDLGIFCKFGTKINHYKIQIKFEFNWIIGSRVMGLDRLKIWIINCFQTISPEWNEGISSNLEKRFITIEYRSS